MAGTTSTPALALLCTVLVAVGNRPADATLECSYCVYFALGKSMETRVASVVAAHKCYEWYMYMAMTMCGEHCDGDRAMKATTHYCRPRLRRLYCYLEPEDAPQYPKDPNCLTRMRLNELPEMA